MLHATRLCGARDGDLAIRVKCLLTAARSDDYRQLIGLAQQFDGHVDLPDIDESSHLQAVLPEPLAVGAQGTAVVGAQRHVGVMARQQYLPGHLVEVEYVDGFGSADDGLRRVRIGRVLRQDRRRGTNRRTAGEETQKGSSGGERRGGVRCHFLLP